MPQKIRTPMNDVCEELRDGIPWSRCYDVSRALRAAERDVALDPAGSIDSLKCLLTIAAKPFVFHKASDFITYGKDLPKLMNAMSWCALNTEDSVRELSALVVANLAKVGIDKEPLHVVAAEGTPILRYIAESSIIEALSNSLNMQNSPSCNAALLSAFRYLTRYQLLCARISEAGIFGPLLGILCSRVTKTDDAFVQTVDIIWNGVDHSEVVRSSLATEESLHAFSVILSGLNQLSHRSVERVLRNDIVSLILVISRAFDLHKKLEASPLIRDLLKMLTGSMASVVSLKEDVELKIILISIITNIALSQGGIIYLLDDFKVVGYLLSIIDGSEASVKSPPSLKVEAMTSLESLARLLPQQFYEYDGCSIVIKFMQTTTDMTHRVKALSLLLEVSEIFNEELTNEFSRLGAVRSLMLLFSTATEERELCLSCVSSLCMQNEHLTDELRTCGGIKSLAKELQLMTRNFQQIPKTFIIHVIHVIWVCIAGSPKNANAFIDDHDGMIHLLDLMEVAPIDMKRQLLGCITDLLTWSSRAVSSFYQWSSTVKLTGGVKQLLDLWAFEQMRAGAVGNYGIVKSPQYPIHPRVLSDDSFTSQSSENSQGGQRVFDASFYVSLELPSKEKSQPLVFTHEKVRSELSESLKASSVDQLLPESVRLSGDCRPLVYAAFKALNFNIPEALSIEDQNHLELIKSFVDCMQLEIWQDIKNSIDNENMQPIADDVRWINSSISELMTKTTEIFESQQARSKLKEKEEIAGLQKTIDAILKTG